MMTYVARLFDAVPYLITNGIKRSGKSHTLNLLEPLCFNGYSTLDPSNATIFRVIHSSFPTFIYDESEDLKGGRTGASASDAEKAITLLNGGYKQGARAHRMEKTSSGGMVLAEFDVFCPKVFGSINSLAPTLRDRAIVLNTYRLPKSKHGVCPKINTLRRKIEAECAELRDQLYTWSLLKFPQVLATYETLDLGERVVNREREVWAPLLAIAKVGEAEDTSFDVDTLFDRMLAFAQVKGEEKSEQDRNEDLTPKVISALLNALDAGELIPTVGTGRLFGDEEQRQNKDYYALADIAKKVTEDLKETSDYKEGWSLSANMVGRILRQVNLITPERPLKFVGGKRRRSVFLTRELVNEVLGDL